MIKILVMAGLPGSGKTTLANTFEQRNVVWGTYGQKNIWNMDYYKNNNSDFDSGMDDFYVNFRHKFKSYQQQVIDGLFLTNEDYANLIKSLYDNNCLSSRKHRFEFHYFIPDREQCLINDKFRDRDKLSQTTIRHAKVEEPDIEFLSQFTKAKINVITHEVYKKTDYELFIEEYKVETLRSDSWSLGGTHCNYNDECFTISPDDEPEHTITYFWQLNKLLEDIFPGMSEEMKQEIFDETVSIYEFSESDYYGGCEEFAQFECNVKTLYKILNEKEMIMMGKLLK